MSNNNITVELVTHSTTKRCESLTGRCSGPRNENTVTDQTSPDLDAMLSQSFRRPQERAKRVRRTTKWSKGREVNGNAKVRDLNIVQINLQGSAEKRDLELIKLLSEHKAHVVLAQEVSLQSTINWNVTGFETFLCGCREQGRACRTSAVLVKKGHRATVRALKSNTGTCAMKVELACGREVVTLINWYQAPSDKKVCLDLGESHSGPTFRNLIIAGDANANHPDFGYTRECETGKWIVDLCSSTNMTSLVTKTTPPTFLSSTGKETRPDQAIVSADILDRVERTILRDVGSDHLPSLIKLKNQMHRGEKNSRSSWNFKKANWHKYTCELEQKLDTNSETLANQSTNECEKFLTDTIMKCAKRNIPRGTVKRFKPFWNKELNDAVVRRQDQRERFRERPTISNRRKYNALTRRSKCISRNSKIESWRSKCTEINDSKDFGQAWKFLNRIKGKRNSGTVQAIRVDDKVSENSRKEAEALNRHFSRTSRVTKSKEIDLENREERRAHLCKASVGQRTFEVPFTKTELEKALSQSKKGKSPGSDGVMVEMLCKLGPKAKAYLLRLYNETWNSGKLPNSWRKATLIPIQKPGKPADDVKSYRPISLTSCLSKTMERMVNNRLYAYIERAGIIDDVQAGFRKKRSTVDQLVSFTESVTNSWQRREHTVACFIDLQNAYDKVWREGLRLKLLRSGVGGKMYQWVSDFLTNRSIRTKLGNSNSSYLPLVDGLPQGSALSCTLFLIYLADIPQTVRTETRLAFADDLIIWHADRNIEHATTVLNSDLHHLSEYCKRWKLLINPTKSVYATFSQSNAVNKAQLEVSLNKVPLKRDENPKYLGLTLDPRLLLTNHVEQVVDKARTRLGLLKSLASTTWGAGSRLLRTLYCSTIRPILEYAAPVLNLASDTTLSKLDKVQNGALRLITGGLQSTAINSMEIAADVEPLKLRREKATMIQNEKIERLPPNDPLRVRMSECKSTKRRLKKETFTTKVVELESYYKPSRDREPIFSEELWTLDNPPEPPNFDLDIGLRGKKAETNELILKSLSKEKLDQYGDNISKIFTDGSAEQGLYNGGYGILLEWGSETETERGPVGTPTCSFDCEAKAMRRASDLILERVTSGKELHHHVVIFCDCLSILLKLASAKIQCGDLGQTMVNIDKILKSGKKVTLCWIPSHVGIRGNDTADELAKEGSKLPQLNRALSFEGAKQYVHREAEQRWKDEWKECEKGRRLYAKQKAPDSKDPWLKLGRKESVPIFRMRSGHTMLRWDLSKHGYDIDTNCRLCGATYENTNHVLTKCQVVPPNKRIQGLNEDDYLYGTLKNMVAGAKIYEWFVSRAQALDDQ